MDELRIELEHTKESERKTETISQSHDETGIIASQFDEASDYTHFR